MLACIPIIGPVVSIVLGIPLVLGLIGTGPFAVLLGAAIF